MDLQGNVIAELAWDPLVNNADITVAVLDNVVTLSGTACSEAQRRAAADAAQRVRNVKTVVNDIQVKRLESQSPPDEQIIQMARSSLLSSALLPENGFYVTVDAGWITLGGKVCHWYQKREAEQIACRLRGVAGVTNNITVESIPPPPDIAEMIQNALQRCAGLDAQWITVEAYKGKVVLRGSVRSQLERIQAETVVACAPGVTEVTNHLAILP